MNDTTRMFAHAYLRMGCMSARTTIMGLLIFACMMGLCLGSEAVTVSVTQFSLVSDPGGLLSEAFVILNSETQSVNLDLEILDWDLTHDGVTQILDADTLERSCSSWMSVPLSEATLAPNSERDIALSIRVPDTARGTYWAGILISVRPTDDVAESGAIAMVRQFLVRVFVTVEPAHTDGRITNLQVHGINPLGVKVAFSNTGNTVLWGVSGIAAIESVTGESLFEIPLAPADILPGHDSTQSVRGVWGLSIAGTYLVRVVVDFGAEYLVAGQVVLVVDELHLAPIGTGDLLPTDRDGDGLYEDVNGDGMLTAADVELLAEWIDSLVVQSNARAFDFSNDGEVTAADTAILQDAVLRAAD